MCEQGHEFTTIEVALDNGTTVADIVRKLTGVGG